MTVWIKGVLFDFDGVIVDSIGAHIKAWESAYHILFQQHLGEEDVNQMIGRSSGFISEFLCKRHHALHQKSQLVSLKYEILKQNPAELMMLPGVTAMFDWLRSQGIPFGIVSNAPSTFVHGTLEQLDLQVPFAYGYEDFKRPKPYPDPYLLGLETLNIEFKDFPKVVVFEDSPHGVKAAFDAYTTVYGISTSGQNQSLKEAGAKSVYKSLAHALKDECFIT
jgi:beta-phosphoglucomutase